MKTGMKTWLARFFTRRGWCEYKGHSYVTTKRFLDYNRKLCYEGHCLRCDYVDYFEQEEDMKDDRWTTRQKWFWYGLGYPATFMMFILILLNTVN